eukprot:6188198-Pleurochrysis_carterae.AAC.2
MSVNTPRAAEYSNKDLRDFQMVRGKLFYMMMHNRIDEDETLAKRHKHGASSPLSIARPKALGTCRAPSMCGRHQYGAPLRPWRCKRAARQRGACFVASYQRMN